MTNAPFDSNAAAQAPGRLARLARRGVVACLLACAGIGAAQAQYHGRRDDAQLPPPPSARAERLPGPMLDQARDQRQFEQMRDQMREQRAWEEQRRQAAQMQQQNEAGREGGRRAGRLTPDERRDLRRQINEAGMDIYPNAQRR